MSYMMRLIILTLMSLAVGCGGGGITDGGPQSAVSGHVPYLIGSPTVTYVKNSTVPTMYDVTVTLEAAGPTGVVDVSLWILDSTDDTNFASLDLTNIPGTRLWSATTNAFVPVPSGQYYLDSIVLHDGDPHSADPLRTGWYFSEPFFSSSSYYVDEREISGMTMPFFNFGVSGIPIARFTLP